MPRIARDPMHWAQVAATLTFTCVNCDNGRHGNCREVTTASPRVQVCTCSCKQTNYIVGLNTPVIGRSGAVVGMRTVGGRIFGYGPMGVPA